MSRKRRCPNTLTLDIRMVSVPMLHKTVLGRHEPRPSFPVSVISRGRNLVRGTYFILAHMRHLGKQFVHLETLGPGISESEKLDFGILKYFNCTARCLMWTKIKYVPRRRFRPREMTETGKSRPSYSVSVHVYLYDH